MYLDRLDFTDDTRILHIAPERGIYRALRAQIPPGRHESYVCADIEPDRDRYRFVENMIKMDLCDLDDQPSAQFDLIIHSHVMEHVRCNIAYTLYHLHRMLKVSGHQVCVIPLSSGYYDECFEAIGDRERTRRFGQHDHVRRFGIEDIDRHLGTLVKLPEKFNAKEEFGEDRLRRANIPEAAWTGFTINTVLVLGKYDMKLLRPER